MTRPMPAPQSRARNGRAGRKEAVWVAGARCGAGMVESSGRRERIRRREDVASRRGTGVDLVEGQGEMVRTRYTLLWSRYLCTHSPYPPRTPSTSAEVFCQYLTPASKSGCCSGILAQALLS